MHQRSSTGRILNRRRKGIRLTLGLMTIYLVKAWQQHLLHGLFLCFMPSAYFRFQAKHVLVPKERSMPQHEGEIENPYSPTAEHIIFVFSRKILTTILFVASFAIQSGKRLSTRIYFSCFQKYVCKSDHSSWNFTTLHGTLPFFLELYHSSWNFTTFNYF